MTDEPICMFCNRSSYNLDPTVPMQHIQDPFDREGSGYAHDKCILLAAIQLNSLEALRTLLKRWIED